MRDILGYTTIPAIVRDYTDEAAIAVMGAENRCRVQLNPLDEARGYQAGMDRFGWDLKTVAGKNGVSTRTVTDRLALLQLCEEAQELVQSGQLTPGYALVLATAQLTRNFQNIALSAFSKNPAPSLVWFRGICADLLGKQAESTMFDLDSFMVANVGTPDPTGAVALPAHPETDSAPVDGTDAIAVLEGQAQWWTQAADAWTLLGKKQEARACKQQVKTLLGTAALLKTLAPVAVPAPVPTLDAPNEASAPAPLPDNVLPLKKGQTCTDCGTRGAANWQVSTREYVNGAPRLKIAQVCRGCAGRRGIAGLPKQRDLWAS